MDFGKQSPVVCLRISLTPDSTLGSVLKASVSFTQSPLMSEYDSLDFDTFAYERQKEGALLGILSEMALCDVSKLVSAPLQLGWAINSHFKKGKDIYNAQIPSFCLSLLRFPFFGKSMIFLTRVHFQGVLSSKKNAMLLGSALSTCHLLEITTIGYASINLGLCLMQMMRTTLPLLGLVRIGGNEDGYDRAEYFLLLSMVIRKCPKTRLMQVFIIDEASMFCKKILEAAEEKYMACSVYTSEKLEMFYLECAKTS